MKFYTNVFRRGNYIFYRGIDEGKKVTHRVKFSPRFFINSEVETAFKSIDGRNLKPKRFKTIYDANEYIELNSYHGMENYVFQFITQKFPDKISFDIDKIVAKAIDIETRSDSGFPNIETADQEITHITITNLFSKDRKYIVFGLCDYEPKNTILKNIKDDIVYIKCKDEVTLLKRFLKYWTENYPDIITGWYTKFFDIPYIINRLKRVFDEEEYVLLSPFKLVYEKNVKENNSTKQAYDIKGIAHLDYKDLFVKFGSLKYGPQESYTLDHISGVVLGTKKLSYEEYGSLANFYKQNPQLFTDYNIRDVELLPKLEEETGLMALAIQMAYKAGCNYEDTFGTVGIWDSIIFREMNKFNIVPPKNRGSSKLPYPGGYVKDPFIGMSHWVVSFDLNSLYPNIIVQYNMSPETIVPGKTKRVDIEDFINGKFNVSREDHEIITATGTIFKNDKPGIIPQIVKEYYSERKIVQAKQKEQEKIIEQTGSKEAKTLEAHYNTEQMSIKILMNSLYGAMANEWFRYFDQRIAEAITINGQMTIKYAENVLNKFINKVMETDNKDYVIAIDTDSVYLALDKLVEKRNPANPVSFLDDFGEKVITPLLDKKFEELSNGLNCIEQRMKMGREVIADKGIWIAKKRYILNVHDKEGIRYNQPKTKMMGIEAVKSSTPQMVKSAMKETFDILMNDSEENLKNYISNFKDDFYKDDPFKIAQPRSVKDIKKWMKPNPSAKTNRDKVWERTGGMYASGTPIHVRASILYNHYVDKFGLDKKYEKIQSGDKIKFVFLKLPNPIHENVIALKNDILPEEFGLHEFIDYNVNYEKTFDVPMRPILDASGYDFSNEVKLSMDNMSDKSDLFSLF